MGVLYIDSDKPRAGKTAVCATLAHVLRQQGEAVSALKPLAPAEGAEADPDSEIYHGLLGLPQWGPPTALPSDGLSPDLAGEVKRLVDEVEKGSGTVIVEGPGALTPEDSGRLAEALDARAMVVVAYRAGLEGEELREWSESLGDRGLGFLFNRRPRYLGADVRDRFLPSLESQGLRSVGVLPEERMLCSLSVGAVAEHLGGRFVARDGDCEALVEHYMVGGFLLDAGELYFGTREDKAVIMRGDRPDLQMAALKTPTTCMILTNGIEPIEYVVNEAELEEVPAMVVDSDTLTTMERLDGVLDLARFDHPLKLERLAELVRANVDVDGLRALLGAAA
jgi:BioD-like phosphotransacetylase family protein